MADVGTVRRGKGKPQRCPQCKNLVPLMLVQRHYQQCTLRRKGTT